MRLKLAITVLSLSIVTVQVLFPEHGPLQPSNVELESGEANSATVVPWANDAEQVDPQSIPPLSLVTVPWPLPVFETVSFGWLSANVAVASSSLFKVTVQLPVPEQAPLQPPKVELASGVAMSVTRVPFWNDAEHVPPQSIPAGLLVTAPEPLPVFDTDSVCFKTENVALADVSPLMLTMQVPDVPEHAPPQPRKVAPVSGASISVIRVLSVKVSLQSSGPPGSPEQSIPAGLLVTVPDPMTVTVSLHGEA